ncbi:MAG: TIGR02996 domain-containing protein [Deltaproteobacteria bacterium]|nr:TIGR02996 domain-containing protein [Deltaproteobacteria bacterium]
MTTEAELVGAIAAALDDDAPRLVYADWLAERGDPRGELIQLQVAVDGMLEEDERRKPTEKRLKALLEEHGESWLGRLVELRRHGMHFAFERGVIGAIAAPIQVLVQHAAKICEVAPLLTRVAIIANAGHDAAALARTPLAPRIRSLAITGAGTPRLTGLDRLELPELRRLELEAIAVGPDDLALLASPHLAAVRLQNCRLLKGVVEAFARVRGPLRRLELPACHLGPRLGELVGAGCRHLAELVLPGNELGPTGVAALRPALATVEHLDLRGNELAPEHLPLVLDEAVIPRVKALLLGGNPLGDAAVTAIVAYPGSRRLTRLHLGDAGVTSLGGRALAVAESLSGLRALTLRGKPFDPQTCAMLVASPFLANARIYVGDRFLARSTKPPPKRPARKPPPA